ncbi:MAG: S-layer homology domain-containing protein [Clostridia bacterium]|nr:S-layer homology domain-containing protein [Clostridia bacterium]
MKLKKILTRAVAIASCVAMLSTNVFAAITTERVLDGGVAKLKVIVTGMPEGWASLLAVDEGTVTNSAWTGAPLDIANIQNAEQADADSNGTVAFNAFGAKTENVEKVDLFVNGKGKTALDIKVATGIYIKETVTLATSSYTYNAKLPGEFETADLTAFFAGKGLELEYKEVGKTDVQSITLNSSASAEVKNKFNFRLGNKSIVDNKYEYPVTVSYNGTAATQTVKVTEEYPEPVTDIYVTGVADTARNVAYYTDDIADYDTADEVAALAKSYIENADNYPNYKVEVTRRGDAPDTAAEYLSNDDLAYVAEVIDTNKYKVTVKYTNVIPETLGTENFATVSATETFKFTIVKNGIDEAVNNTVSTPDYAAQIPAKDWPLTVGTDGTVEKIFTEMSDSDFAALNLFNGEFGWNNPAISNTAIKRSDLEFSAAVVSADANSNTHTFTVTITLKDNDKFIGDIAISPAASFTVTATKKPFEIVGAELVIDDIPATKNDGYVDGTLLPATAYVNATVKLDGELSSEPAKYESDTFHYYTNESEINADGVWISKASVAAVDTTTPGTYYLDAVIYDSKSDNADKKFAVVDDLNVEGDERLCVKVIEEQPIEPLTVTSDGRIIEVPYGTTDIETAIRTAAAESDLFVTMFTNENTSDIDPNAVEYTIPEGAINVSSVNGLIPGDYEATVSKVIAVADSSELMPVNNKIKIKVNVTTVKEIALIGEWTKENQQEVNSFPGFGADHKIGVVYDDATCVSAPVQDNYHVVADIVVDNELNINNDADVASMVEDTAYINTTTYNSASVGLHTLSVYIKDSAVGGVYAGSIKLEVLPAVDTNKVALVSGVDVWCANNPNAETAKENAKAAVDAAIANDGILKIVKTNGDLSGDFVTGYTLAAGEIDDDIIPVTITITNTDYSFKEPVKNVVNVQMINNIQLKGAEFVDGTGAQVTPSIKAAKAPYETNPALLEMDWSAYKIKATYTNPITGELTETETYEYKATDDGVGKYYTVSGWVNFKDGAAVGNQNVTVKVYDVEKANTNGYALSGTLTAVITASDEPSAYVKVKPNTTISVDYGTSEVNAIGAIKASATIIQQIYKDGTTKDSTVKANAATITSYNQYVPANYVATVTGVEGGATVESGALTIIVKEKYTPNVVTPGTVVGGGGSSGGGGGISFGGGTTTNKDDNSTADTEEPPVKEDTTGTENTAQPETTTPVVGGDIPVGHYAEEATKKLITKGIISGDQNGNVNLDATFTRAQMAKIAAVIHANGGDIAGGSVEGIVDAHSVPAWSKDYVAYVVANGIITGHADGSFDPNGMVSRAQLAAILLRLYGYGEGDGANLSAYGDIDASHWARAALSKCVELGIMSGYEDSTMKPDKSVTTAEACVMINRAMALYEALQAAIAQ